MTYTISATVASITLPNQPDHAPITLVRNNFPIVVCDHTGKFIERILPGESATFEIKRPKRWLFWRNPKWVKK